MSRHQKSSAHEDGSYLIEFITMGASVKVSAIDPVSKQEVSIIGPKQAHKDELIRVAVRKLEYMMAKN